MTSSKYVVTGAGQGQGAAEARLPDGSEPALEDFLLAVPRDHPLLKMEHVIITPHLGSAADRTREAMAGLAVRNVAEVLANAARLR